MTSASSLHFGPEWMRKPSRGSLAPLSPNITGNSPGTTSSLLPTPPNPASTQLPNVSSYSSLLTSASPPPQIKSEDENYPFRYSKEQLLRVWKDGGGRGGLGLEVERWPGIVREVGGEPQGAKEMTPEERKIFSVGVNSDPPIRRNTANLSLASDRQSNKLGQGIGIGLGPASPRGIGAPRRRATGATDDPAAGPFVPRKLSLSSTLLAGNVGVNTPGSPGIPLPSPNTRNRLPSGENADATTDGWVRGSPAAPTDSPWSVMGARRRTNDTSRGWGNAGGTPGIGLGIGRGISFGSLANGTPSADGKTSPSISPGPGPVSTSDAVAPANEESTTQPTSTTSDAIQPPALTTNTIYATNGNAPESTEDFATMQWSYKDPTGQIQGPFAGATMQQWFETGYFAEDLLIKRTHVDSDFEPLRDFRRRAPPLRPGEAHVQMFLSPLAPRAPPNLPAPHALLRGADTPPNPSPRLAHLLTGIHDASNHGPMSAGASGGSPLVNSPTLSAARGTTLDSYLTPGQNGLGGTELVVAGGAGLTNEALERKKREEFIQSLRERELAMGVGAASPQAFGSTGPFGGGFASNPSTPFGPYAPGTPSAFNSRLNVPMPLAPIPTPVSNASLNAVSPFPHNGPVLWSSTDPMTTPGAYTAPSNDFDHGTIYQSAPSNLGAWQAVAPTWGDEDDLPPAVEAAVNIADETLHTPVSDSQVHDSPSSWHPELPVEPEVENMTTAFEETRIHNREAEPTPIANEASPTSSKRKNKGKAANKEPPVPVSALTPPSPVISTPVSPPAHATAWATAEDKTTSLSLRDIQQAEARKAEARKAAERVTKASAPVLVAEETVNVTGSWGLPQVGARANASASAAAANNGPAWTKPAAAPSGKKSMKEIQEEEERRKKAVAAAASANATKETPAATSAQQAAKRAYADSAKNVATTATGGTWTTVGPLGKTNLPPPTVRQPSTTSAAAPATRAVPGSSAPRPGSSASNATQPAGAAKPVKSTSSDETPVPPSLDFLKWLKESLKGLNGINVEEFMQMLLSFPLDPSPAVVEIISDSIYANSSTLDGRRFAAEFCQKRKADAAAARAKPSSASGTKVPRASLAEVVKTQPKPVQSEWGFKTVQKKPKGGRK
ncbi:GYF domain protein [Rhizoctonia solani AG-3 Rhs1AP]|uniref:GYF domain protein n=1 Tax=Rhizoctonia solani AG-3 Rhs1AP TaxID=1086054 RepID=X8JDG2_9AGAM|nr:GYF domain protein [Rhizoctonia solani AG-3 Rhs1AP]